METIETIGCSTDDASSRDLLRISGSGLVLCSSLLGHGILGFRRDTIRYQEHSLEDIVPRSVPVMKIFRENWKPDKRNKVFGADFILPED